MCLPLLLVYQEKCCLECVCACFYVLAYHSVRHTPEHGMTGLVATLTFTCHGTLSWHHQPCHLYPQPYCILSFGLCFLGHQLDRCEYLSGSMPGISEVSILLGPYIPTCLISSSGAGRPGSRVLPSVLSRSVQARGAQAMSFSEVTMPGPALPPPSAVNPDS